MDLLAARVALIDNFSDCQDLFARNRLFLIGLSKRLLDLAILGPRDLHRDCMGNDAALDGGDQFLLAVLE